MKDEAKIVTALSRPSGGRAQPEDDEIDLMELARALWRGKWVIVLTTVVAMLLAGAYVFGVADPKYRSTIELVLEARTQQVVDIKSVISGVSTDDATLNTEIEVLLSRRLLGKLVDRLGLIDDAEFNTALNPPSALDQVKGVVAGLISSGGDGGSTEVARKTPRDKTIDALREALSALVKRDTFVYELSATTGDPQKSALIINTLAEIYIDEQIAVKFEATEKAVAWLSGRVTELEAELREKEETLKAARSATDLVSPEALEGLNLQAKDLRDRLQEMRAEADRAAGSETRLDGFLQTADRAGATEATGDATLRRLMPQVDAGDAGAGRLFDQRLETLAARARAEGERLRSQTTALSDSFDRLQARIARQSEDLLRIQQMGREVETTRTLYETFLTRLKETAVQRGLQQADSRILSDAIVGEKVAPRVALTLALAMVLGAMAGAATALVRQFLHNTFRTAEDLEAATGLTVMGQIPKMPFGARKDLIGYLRDKPTSAAAEAVRNLRTSILLSDIDAPPRVIMSTSALPGEGKTTQSISLVQNLAGLGKKVLLLEGDIRRRTFSEYFDNPSRRGIISALSGRLPLHEIVFHDDRLGADVLMGEKSHVNAADLFSSERFHDFIKMARETYDYVIIDTPPVLVVPDSRVIGQHVDAIVFTVAWDKTHRGQVTAAMREFQSVNLRVTGLVLAQIDPRGMRRYGYGGKYGAYSTYGRGYYEAG